MEQQYFRRYYRFTSTLVVIALAISACASPGPSAPASETPTEEPTAAPPEAMPATEAPSATQAAAVGGALEINNDDPCSLLTQEQVEAGFGQGVREVKANAESIGKECEFEFENEDTQLRVTYYEGEAAKNYFAVLVTAGKQSCDEFLDAIFDIAFAPLAEKYPSADQSLLELPLEDLYRQYIGTLGECMYIHTEDRADLGNNVIAIENIFLNLGSNLAILSDERVIELNYTEPLPTEVQQALSAGTSRESYYALADPYRQQILTGYTATLTELLKQATGQ